MSSFHAIRHYDFRFGHSLRLQSRITSSNIKTVIDWTLEWRWEFCLSPLSNYPRQMCFQMEISVFIAIRFTLNDFDWYLASFIKLINGSMYVPECEWENIFGWFCWWGNLQWKYVENDLWFCWISIDFSDRLVKLRKWERKSFHISREIDNSEPHNSS